MLKALKAYGFLILLGGAVVLLDQATKAWVRTTLAFGDAWTPFADFPWLQITHWKNQGMAFGLGQAWGALFLAVGVVYTLGVLLAFPLISKSGWWLRWGMAIQWGGALGNLIDRWHQGYVTDFIAVQRFPVFNLADAAITISIVFLLIGEFMAAEEAPQPETPPPAEPLPAAAETFPTAAPEEPPHAP